MLERNPWLRALIVLLVFLAGLYLAGLLWELVMRFGDVIIVFVLAWLLAFALRPLAKALHVGLRFPWVASVALIYLLFFAVTLTLGIVLVPLLVTQMSDLAVAIPNWLQQLAYWYVEKQSTLPEQLQAANLGNILSPRDLAAQAQQMAATIVQNAVALATGVASALVGLVIVLVVSFYFTLDGERLTDRGVHAIPSQYREEVRFLLDSVARSFGGFLRGQLVQAIVYASGTAIVMWIAGLGYIVLSTTIAGLAMVIPFVGPIVALVAPITLAAAQGGPTLAIQVFVALLVLQQIVFNVLAPKVMSEAVGLHPVLVLLAILVGGKAAGLAGAIFGVPVAAVITAMVVYFYRRANPRAEPEADGSAPTAARGKPRLAAPHARVIWESYSRRLHRTREE